MVTHAAVNKSLVAFILCAMLALTLSPLKGTTGPRIQRFQLPDGVVLWRADQADKGKPQFFALFEEIAKVLMPSSSELPFNRSVAFLVGVSEYAYIEPDLPFVKNDLEDMKNYLLLQGGFDEVYVASNTVVSSELVESYMMNKFRRELGKRDRLLFYYAGHGADAAGTTGYLQFTMARPGDFAKGVLSVVRVLEWGQVNPAAHMLFVLDTCSSGLAFAPRVGSSEEEEQRLIFTLSGSGSRAVITAGTAEERTFEVKGLNGRGNGVFTRALLGALGVGRARDNTPAFLTVDQVFADLKVSVAKFSAINRKSLNPKLWTFDDDQYRGSFIFLNPAVRMGRVQEDHLARIKAQPRGLDYSSTTVMENQEYRLGSDDELIVSVSAVGYDSKLRGRVTSRNGKALRGVRVSLQKGKGYSTRITGRDGYYELQYPEDGTYHLGAERKGFKPTLKIVRIERGMVTLTPTLGSEMHPLPENLEDIEPGLAAAIYFPSGSAALSSAAKKKLSEVATRLNTDPALRVNISRGRAWDFNRAREVTGLFDQRAAVIDIYLVIYHGIHQNRISAEEGRSKDNATIELVCMDQL